MTSAYAGKVGGAASPTDTVFSDYGLGYFYVNHNVAVASPAAGDFCFTMQGIEGFNMADLRWGTANAKPASLSFKATINGIGNGAFSVAIRNGSSARSFTHLCNCGASGVAVPFRIFIPGDTTGTWVKDFGLGAQLSFTTVSGSTFTSPANDAWQAGNYIAGPGQSNIGAAVNNNLVISDVQFETGPICTPLDVRSLGHELLLAQRFYQKTYDYATAVGATSSSGALYCSPTASAAYWACLWRFQQRMRIQPTIALYGYKTGIATTWENPANSNQSAAVASGQGENSVLVLMNGGSIWTGDGNPWYIHATANAEF